MNMLTSYSQHDLDRLRNTQFLFAFPVVGLLAVFFTLIMTEFEGAFAALIFTLSTGLCATYFWKREMKILENNLRLHNSGKKVKALIIDVPTMNFRQSIKNYYIVAQYQDPRTKKIVLFESDSLFDDPTIDLTQNTFIDVYIDPTDPGHNYWVDTMSIKRQKMSTTKREMKR